jgi:hypothetical protein
MAIGQKRSLRAVLWSESGQWKSHIVFRRVQDLEWLKHGNAQQPAVTNN